MEWVNFIKEIGFPIFVGTFLLVRLNGKVGENTRAIKENTKATNAVLTALQAFNRLAVSERVERLRPVHEKRKGPEKE